MKPDADDPQRLDLPSFPAYAVASALLLVACLILIMRRDRPAYVYATRETQPVRGERDAADDICIWIHPTDPTRSVIIGTDKDRGICVYNLDGQEIEFRPDGRLNNVDCRSGFPYLEREIPLVVASNRSDNSILCYTIQPEARTLTLLGRVQTDLEIYGLCLYKASPLDASRFYVFVTGKDGRVQQYRLEEAPSESVAGAIQGKKVRELQFESVTEGCVADDTHGWVYIGEEDVGLWKLNARPDASGSTRTLIIRAGFGRPISPDLEGVTIYPTNGESGYLLLSSQGDNRFIVLDRQEPHPLLGSFKIASNRTLNIDAVSGTDGIDVTNAALGPDFPLGLMIAQDDKNDDANQNFKMVPWHEIRQALELP